MHFLRAGVDKRFDAHKAPHSAATGQIDVVGGFKVVAAVILAQLCAETDRRYAVTGAQNLSGTFTGKMRRLSAPRSVCLMLYLIGMFFLDLF